MQLPLSATAESEGDAFKSFTLDFPEAEVVFGLVYAVGTNYQPVMEFLTDCIRLGGYRVNPVKVSDFFGEWEKEVGATLNLKESPELDRVKSRIDAGNLIRQQTGRNDFLALQCASRLSASRALE